MINYALTCERGLVLQGTAQYNRDTGEWSVVQKSGFMKHVLERGNTVPDSWRGAMSRLSRLSSHKAITDGGKYQQSTDSDLHKEIT